MGSKQSAICEVRVVVDTNIIFSGILSPKSNISDLLLNSDGAFEFYAPDFMLVELEKHDAKLIKLSGYTAENLDFVKGVLLKKIYLINLEAISPQNWQQALAMTKEIDEFDAPFVALALEMRAYLWSGDKKLMHGLQKQGFPKAVDLSQLLQIRIAGA